MRDGIGWGMSHLKLTNPGHRWHLTIIHVGGVVPFRMGPEGLLDPLVCRVIGEDVFGTEEEPVRGMVVEASRELLALRERAEEELRAAGLGWSHRWPFRPHVTIAEGEGVVSEVVFTQVGWTERPCLHG